MTTDLNILCVQSGAVDRLAQEARNKERGGAPIFLQLQPLRRAIAGLQSTLRRLEAAAAPTASKGTG